MVEKGKISLYVKKLRKENNKLLKNHVFQKDLTEFLRKWPFPRSDEEALKQFGQKSYRNDKKWLFNKWGLSNFSFLFSNKPRIKPPLRVGERYIKGRPIPFIERDPDSAIKNVTAKDRREVDKHFGILISYYYPPKETRGRKRDTLMPKYLPQMRQLYRKLRGNGVSEITAIEKVIKKFHSKLKYTPSIQYLLNRIRSRQ